ncbi:Hypothetical predicted protein [Podarcis lilfordi]|uniref:Uncharacterized protein n=1 Tax=Podarcis lilfordi TaxID=74358 RepID=A0AA35KLN5_9SAUR|nr:Hypothetical predicted protein [Podarcis lilfordi]
MTSFEKPFRNTFLDAALRKNTFFLSPYLGESNPTKHTPPLRKSSGKKEAARRRRELLHLGRRRGPGAGRGARGGGKEEGRSPAALLPQAPAGRGRDARVSVRGALGGVTVPDRARAA